MPAAAPMTAPRTSDLTLVSTSAFASSISSRKSIERRSVTCWTASPIFGSWPFCCGSGAKAPEEDREDEAAGERPDDGELRLLLDERFLAGRRTAGAGGVGAAEGRGRLGGGRRDARGLVVGVGRRGRRLGQGRLGGDRLGPRARRRVGGGRLLDRLGLLFGGRERRGSVVVGPAGPGVLVLGALHRLVDGRFFPEGTLPNQCCQPGGGHGGQGADPREEAGPHESLDEVALGHDVVFNRSPRQIVPTMASRASLTCRSPRGSTSKIHPESTCSIAPQNTCAAKSGSTSVRSSPDSCAWRTIEAMPS